MNLLGWLMTVFRKVMLAGLIVAVCGLSLLYTPCRALLLSHGLSAETRGLHLARSLGCFHCHGADARGGIANPGAGKVPALNDFAFLMSVNSETDLRAWILDGAPQQERDQPDFEASKGKRAVAMPAYGNRLSAAQLEDLLSWYHSIAGTVFPRDAQAIRGYKTAKKTGCFSCHGGGGRLDKPNPGSFAGFIPAWHGEDFEELARDEQEVRTWILDGNNPRLLKNPVARWFMERQTIQMPAYRNKISEQDLEDILVYLRWLRDPSQPGHAPSYQDHRPEEKVPNFY